ncbi:MAG: hypothetical protein Q7S98_06915, partial [Deltaproteobacteria bacterium]|nr:hypothetical protein [Deltaproteobacteria bacterium]
MAIAGLSFALLIPKVVVGATGGEPPAGDPPSGSVPPAGEMSVEPGDDAYTPPAPIVDRATIERRQANLQRDLELLVANLASSKDPDLRTQRDFLQLLIARPGWQDDRSQILLVVSRAYRLSKHETTGNYPALRVASGIFWKLAGTDSGTLTADAYAVFEYSQYYTYLVGRLSDPTVRIGRKHERPYLEGARDGAVRDLGYSLRIVLENHHAEFLATPAGTTALIGYLQQYLSIGDDYLRSLDRLIGRLSHPFIHEGLEDLARQRAIAEQTLRSARVLLERLERDGGSPPSSAAPAAGSAPVAPTPATPPVTSAVSYRSSALPIPFVDGGELLYVRPGDLVLPRGIVVSGPSDMVRGSLGLDREIAPEVFGD